jgi:hypothetical protein
MLESSSHVRQNTTMSKPSDFAKILPGIFAVLMANPLSIVITALIAISILLTGANCPE